MTDDVLKKLRADAVDGRNCLPATHWDWCYKERGHEDCAIIKLVDHLTIARLEIERLRSVGQERSDGAR